MAGSRRVTEPGPPAARGFMRPREDIPLDAMLTHQGRKSQRAKAMGLTDRERAVGELNKFHAALSRTRFEVTTYGWGLPLADLKALSEATGLQIVASAGFYTWASIPQTVDEHGVDDVASALIAALTRGRGWHRRPHQHPERRNPLRKC